MSYSSYSRLRAGIVEPTHTISAPVVPQAIDLRNLTRPRRGQAVAAAGNTRAGGIANLADMTDAIIASAKGLRKPQQQGPEQPEQARQQHQQATLDRYTQAAEDQAAQPSQRHGIYLPGRDEVAASTADTRWANGPLGGFGGPSGSPLGNTPGTFGGGFNGGF